MAIHNLICVTLDETQGNTENDLMAENNLVELAGLKLKTFFRAITSGIRPAVVYTKSNAVKATGTVTLSAHVATDTVTVSGVVLTAVVSGATGPQYNVGGSDAITADNLAAAINENATLSAIVKATSALGVVTLTALMPGALGNAVTLAISAHGTVSAARLAGGTNGTMERTHYYGSAT